MQVDEQKRVVVALGISGGGIICQVLLRTDGQTESLASMIGSAHVGRDADINDVVLEPACAVRSQTIEEVTHQRWLWPPDRSEKEKKRKVQSWLKFPDGNFEGRTNFLRRLRRREGMISGSPR